LNDIYYFTRTTEKLKVYDVSKEMSEMSLKYTEKNLMTCSTAYSLYDTKMEPRNVCICVY